VVRPRLPIKNMIVGTNPAPTPTEDKPKTEEEQISESRKSHVRELTDTIKAARDFWQPVFERIREDMNFAGGDQWQDAEDKMSDKYQVNFVQRELQQEVSAIYAKNPTVTCDRVHRLEYTVWDGTEQMLRQAMQAIESAAGKDMALAEAGPGSGAPEPQGPPKEAVAIVTDYKAGADRKKLYDKIAKTLEIVFNHELDNQSIDFEQQMKDLILCEKTTSVGFLAVKFRRENETVPTSSATQASVLERMQQIGQIAAELRDQENYADDSPCHDQIKSLVLALAKAVQGENGKPQSEGLVLDFKPTTSVIVDPKCRSLTEFVGADWVVEEFMMAPDQIEEQWKVDVRNSAIQYMGGRENSQTVTPRTKAGGAEAETTTKVSNWADKAEACVWIMYHKRDQMKYVICHGFENFLEEPEAPWPPVNGFWNILALKLTRTTVEENMPQKGVTIYGQSTCRLLRPMQEEMNRSQEGLREHRVANRPGHICGKDTFTNNDRKALASRKAHDVIPLDNVPPGGDTAKVLASIPTVPIDPALYRTDGVMQHAMMVSGQQQANIGQQAANEKATGQAIAEQSRVQNVSSEVDSLDKFLSRFARVAGEMLLTEMSEETVKEKAGPGAAWAVSPDMRAAIRKHLFLKIKAGSAGRPNRALEIANLKELMPQLIDLAHVKGLPLDPLIKHAAKILEFDFDIEEWLAQADQSQSAGAAQKGASESISIKLGDLNPDERAQALRMAGIEAGQPPAPVPTKTTSQPVGAGPTGQPARVPSSAAAVTRMAPK
jgi:hypothetical protein